MRVRWMGAALVAMAAAGAAWGQTAQSGLTITFEGVHSATGRVMVSLCNNPQGGFPNGCNSYRGMVNATAGETVVTFPDLPDGSYALQGFHDENGDFRPEIPAEGFAYGNNATFPPTFANASFAVHGATQVRVRMTYLGRPGAPVAESRGTEPPAGVERVDVRDNGLYGELYRPAGGGRHPAILLLGGSEGGLDVMSGMAISFAKQGYAAMALAYWRGPGLPQTLEHVPLEYFDKGVAWLKARPDVDGTAIGAIGWSRGSEAVLLLGSRNPDVHAVTAIAPSGIVWKGLNFADMAHVQEAWTLGGQPVPYATPNGADYRPDQPAAKLFASGLSEADRHPETEIAVERINGPVMLIAGEDDHLFPSVASATRIAARLKQKRFRHAVEMLSYPGAGHATFVGEPDGVLARAMANPNPMFGGSPAADKLAWADNWPKALHFFDQALRRKP